MRLLAVGAGERSLHDAIGGCRGIWRKGELRAEMIFWCCCFGVTEWLEALLEYSLVPSRHKVTAPNDHQNKEHSSRKQGCGRCGSAALPASAGEVLVLHSPSTFSYKLLPSTSRYHCLFILSSWYGVYCM